MNDDSQRFEKSNSPLTRCGFLRLSTSATAAVGGGVLLASCAGSGNGATSEGKTQLTFMPVIPLESMSLATQLLADSGGFFADQNLDVSFQSSKGSAQAIQLVLSGKALLTRIGQIEGMKHAANNQAPLANVGTLYKGPTVRYVSSAKDPMKEPQDFVGKTIGVPSQGGTSETTLKLALSVSGVDLKRVSFQVVGLNPGVFNLVEQGRIAAYAASVDTAKILEQRRSDTVVFHPGDFMDSGSQFFMTSQPQLSSDSATIGKYLEAVYGAVEFMLDDDGFDKTLKTIRKKYSFDTLNNTAVAKASLEEYVKLWTSEGRDNMLRTVPEKWQKGYQEMVSAGLAGGGHDPSQWYTNKFVPKSG